jgi:hypothetical protein
MAKNHEYALLDGVNRSNIGRILAILASLVSGAIVSLLILLVNYVESLGLIQFPQVLAVPVTAGLVYLAIYAIFRDYAWKWPKVNGWLQIPDLSGTWACEGVALNSRADVDPAWVGTITITQDWDKIRVSLQTGSSKSESISAALQFDEHHGCHLLYTYKNEPKADSPLEMQYHRGAVQLTFSADLSTAEGDYFNGRGRYTFGTMKLKKE